MRTAVTRPKIRFVLFGILVAARLSIAQTNPVPTNALQHAQKATDYIRELNGDLARAELQEAERLDPTNNFDLEAQIFFAHCNLHDITDAVYYGHRCLALGQAPGISSNMTGPVLNACREFEARQVPAFIEAIKPREYSATELEDALRKRLSPAEVSFATNPLMGTEAMVAWARELTVSATNDMQKAQMLFDTLSRRLNGSELGFLTAREAFVHWNDTNISLHCQEYAFLYTSLARDLGLEAFSVVVDETCYGEKTAHACAAVFLGKKTLLVDPSYDWFGVLHKRYRILDDLGAIALYLSPDVNHSDKVTIAYKLAPDLPQVQAAYFLLLVQKGKWDEARSLVSEISKSDPSGWGTCDYEAALAVHDNDLKRSAQLLEKSIQINPLGGAAYINLGSVRYRLGDLAGARNAYLESLKCELPKNAIDAAHACLKFLDKEEAAQTNQAKKN